MLAQRDEANDIAGETLANSWLEDSSELLIELDDSGDQFVCLRVPSQYLRDLGEHRHGKHLNSRPLCAGWSQALEERSCVLGVLACQIEITAREGDPRLPQEAHRLARLASRLNDKVVCLLHVTTRGHPVSGDACIFGQADEDVREHRVTCAPH